MINKILKKIYYEKYTNKSYSISNVDLIINRMFSKIKNGIYVDVGCNHPKNIIIHICYIKEDGEELI